MQRKFFFSLFFISLLIVEAQGQIISVSSKPVVSAASSQTDKTSTAAQTERLLNKEEIEALIKAEPVAAAMTPEQKAEIDTKAKKNMLSSVKRQRVRDRKDFISSMTAMEKVIARRKALSSGQSIEEAALVEEAVEYPDVNPFSDKEMQNYLFEKAGLNSSSSASESVSDAK